MELRLEKNPAINRIIPIAFPACSRNSNIVFSISYFPLTKSFNVDSNNTNMPFRIKAWMIYLIGLGLSLPIGLVSGDMELAGSLTVDVMIWGSVALGIHYLVRNAGNKEIMFYGVVAVPLVFGIWYFAFTSNIEFTFAIGLTIAVAINGIYHSIKRMVKKEGKTA